MIEMTTGEILADLSHKFLEGELTIDDFQNGVRATEQVKPDKLHAPPNGTIFRHYKDDALYRKLFEVDPADATKAVVTSMFLLEARVATNYDEAPYRKIGVYIFGGVLWAPLPYKAVIYVSQTTLEVYAREYNEFYGGVDAGASPVKIVRRFEPVAT